MTDTAGELWLILQLARKSLESGTLRDYWPDLARHGAGTVFPTRAIAALVWIALVPVVPAIAARRRRLIGQALEGVVRAVVSGVEVPAAVNRAVAWLERKGIESRQARADVERLLDGFLSSPSRNTSEERDRDAGSRFTSAGSPRPRPPT